jgi:hypothetical protein
MRVGPLSFYSERRTFFHGLRASCGLSRRAGLVLQSSAASRAELRRGKALGREGFLLL